MSLIKCSNLTLAYEGNPAVSDVSFTVNQGDYLCIVGENGAGKTTLIKGILGLKEPYSGEIKRSKAIKNAIGYLPQQTNIQRNFPATSYEVVLSGCLNNLGHRPFYGRAERSRAKKVMRLLGISKLANKSYRELSGGQQQRVLLARALCAAHKIILLDEPVSGLDPLATKELYRLIKRINVDMGMAVIMVSHDINSAIAYGTHILHVKAGNNTDHFFGSVEEYKVSKEGRAFIEGIKQEQNDDGFYEAFSYSGESASAASYSGSAGGTSAAGGASPTAGASSTGEAGNAGDTGNPSHASIASTTSAPRARGTSSKSKFHTKVISRKDGDLDV